MSSPANVRSIQTIADFRSLMVGFGAETMSALEEIDMEVRRVVDWLVSDRPTFWKNELRRAWDKVAEARGELERCMQKGIGKDRPSCFEEKKALDRAKAYTRTCEQKIEAVKHWTRVVTHEVSEYEGRLTSLRNTLETDLPRSIAVLGRMVQALEKYTQLQGPGGDAAGAASMAAGSGGSGGPGGSGRSNGSSFSPDQHAALVAKLRAQTPAANVRPGVPVLTADQPVVEVGVVGGQAFMMVKELGFKLTDIPGRCDKIVVAAGALDGGDVYAERLRGDREDGMPKDAIQDSGWYIGPLESKAEPKLEAIRICDLRHSHPQILRFLMLPPGTLCVFEGGEPTLLFNKENKTLAFAHLLPKPVVKTEEPEESGGSLDFGLNVFKTEPAAQGGA